MSNRVRLFLLSYFFVGVLAVGAGVLLPETTALLSPYTAVFLGVIFFLSALRIDSRAILACLLDAVDGKTWR
jgi:predicted Na+-dependent transporter